MTGETELALLLKNMRPELNAGDYVFCTCVTPLNIDKEELVCCFKEAEGTTVIISKELADKLNLGYTFIACWITLQVHSSLSAVGLTAAVSKALTDANISCNIVSAYFHDHIFVDSKDAEKAMVVLEQLSLQSD